MADTEQPDDRVAIRLCIDGQPRGTRGQKEAFGILVKRYMERAFYTALALVGNPDDAFDLSQEAFVRAFRSIKKFRPETKFFTWYYAILRNLCLNHLRNRRRHAVPFTEVGGIAELPDGESDPSVLAEENEAIRILWKSMSALEPEDRELITLKDLQNLSYREIAEVLHIPAGTVMSRLYHARRKLKKVMEGYL